MIDHNPLPEKIQPRRLLLRTGGACDLDPGRLFEVFGEQRQRFVAVLRGFGPDDWAAPTRCAEWSAHDVIRHLCDCNALAAGVGPDDRTLDIAAGFDPRITPRVADRIGRRVTRRVRAGNLVHVMRPGGIR